MTDPFFPSTLRLRIDWSELDLFGHVNNVSFFKYIQASRVHYWDQVGITELHKTTQLGPMLVSCKCDFKKPLFHPGHVDILAKIDFIKNTSFGLYHRILNEQGELAAEAYDVMVMYDFERDEKQAFPKEIRERIEHFEKSKTS